MKRIIGLFMIVLALLPSQQMNAQSSDRCPLCHRVWSLCPGHDKPTTVKCPDCHKPIDKCEFKGNHIKEEASGPHSIIVTYDETMSTIVIDSTSRQVLNDTCTVSLEKGEYKIILTMKEKEIESPYLLNKKADDIYAEATSLQKEGKINAANLKFKEALNIYKKAAVKENRDAQYSLGFQYHHGVGTEKNVKEALKWYTKSAENGRASAQKVLGSFYLKGEMNLPKDVNKAMEWLGKAAANYTKNANSKKRDQEYASQTYDILINEIEKMHDNESSEYLNSLVSDLEKSSTKAILAYDLGSASVLIDKGLKLQDTNLVFMNNYGVKLLLMGENEAAFNYYKEKKKEYGSKLLEALEMYEKKLDMTSGCKKQLEEIKKMLMR